MRIAVIGTGNIGGTLGRKWLTAGYDVVFGSRSAAFSEGPGGAPLVPVADALADADVVMLAVPGGAVTDVVRDHHAALGGTVVIDAVNRMGEAELNSRVLISGAARDVQYVRAFSTLGWENFANPVPGTDLFFAADAEARGTAEELISAIGLGPVYLGGPEASGTVDALAPLWLALVQQHGGNRRIALHLVQ
jgi:8-hydroxy-5-deazaflavin:NADPH oxidoreductase